MSLRRIPSLMLSLSASAAVTAALVGPAAAAGPDLASQTDRLKIMALAQLPQNPAAGQSDAFCPVLTETPQTPAGDLVAKAGWMVSGEITFGSLTFVSFVGRAEQGTSGSCLLSDGNIGIFEGEVLRGLVYDAAASDPEAPGGIGWIDALEGNALRIWDGDYLGQPVADLQAVGDALVLLRPVASRDSFCGGAVSVPNLYGLPIHQARQLVLAEGWAPAPAAEAPAMGWTADMRADWPELDDCGGTGFGYCAWNYAKAPNETLSVTTAGEAPEGSSPAVIGFTASCAG